MAQASPDPRRIASALARAVSLSISLSLSLAPAACKPSARQVVAVPIADAGAAMSEATAPGAWDEVVRDGAAPDTPRIAAPIAPRIVTRIVDGQLIIEELPADAALAAADHLGGDDAKIAAAPPVIEKDATDDACARPRGEMVALAIRVKSEPERALEDANAVLRTSGACRMDKALRAARARILLEVARPLSDPARRRDLLEESVDLAPSRDALTLLARTADEQNDLKVALARYREAADLDPAARFTSRIKDLEKKLAVEDGFAKRATQHFIVRFEGDERAELADLALRQLDEVRVRLRDTLGVEPSAPVNVVLYIGDQYRRATSGPDWSGGVFDGKIRIKEAQLRGSDLQNVLTHEYVHALVRGAARQGVPAWFNEGLAQRCEPGLDRVEKEGRRASVKRDALPTLATLGRGFGAQRDGKTARLYYAFALDLVDEMVRTRTERSLASLLDELENGKPFAAAFAEVYGMDLALFESRWRSRYPS